MECERCGGKGSWQVGALVIECGDCDGKGEVAK